MDLTKEEQEPTSQLKCPWMKKKPLQPPQPLWSDIWDKISAARFDSVRSQMPPEKPNQCDSDWTAPPSGQSALSLELGWFFVCVFFFTHA